MRISVLGVVVLFAVSAAAAPVARFDAGGGGFIDDGYALSEDGRAIAYLTTDGATTATLHLVEAGHNEVKVTGAPIDATAVCWLSTGRVLVISGQDASFSAQAFTAAGPESRKLGPFGRLALATVDGKRAVVTYTRSEKRAVEYALVAYAIDTLRPIKRRTWREDGEGQLRLGFSSLKFLWWSDGFTVLAGLRAGEFDKARDMRRPDRYVRVDIFSGKVLDEQAVQDVLAFTQVALLRRDAPNRPVLVRFSDDHRKLLFVDGIGESDVILPRELLKYDVNTLASQLLDERHVAVSLTIDPVNPDAVARKKADVDEIDFYNVDRQTRAVRALLRLPGEGRRSTWQIAGDRLLLLRKGKGFDRGGVALELYELPDAARVAKP